MPIITQVLKNSGNHSVLFFRATDSEDERSFLITGNDIFNRTDGEGGQGSHPPEAASHLTGYPFDTSRAEIQPPPKVYNKQPRRIKSFRLIHPSGMQNQAASDNRNFGNIRFKFADGTNNEFTAFVYGACDLDSEQGSPGRSRNLGQNQGFGFDPPLESPLTGSDWALLLEVLQAREPLGGKNTQTADEFSLSGIIELVE